MTIAVVIKVNDGIVLAADSATTLVADDGQGGQKTSNIYNNANKVFNLRKGLPIGMMTWGLGNIGQASISTLAKDLRRDLTSGPDRLDPDNYSLSDVAARVRTFFYDDRYEPMHGSSPSGSLVLGLLVAGYSSQSDVAETHLITLDSDQCSDPEPAIDPDNSGASWWGQPAAITRLVNGIDPTLPQALINLGVKQGEAVPYTQEIARQVSRQLVSSAMPIQDAIDLAEYLVDLTIKFVRFCPGDAVVGGPIEISAITKHEGFKWATRKYYYTQEMNPEG